ncbi:MAG: MazG nucleotide pyrophosphohydrolase domain-containing protein, partial [Thermodesulfobacteriota bacterium]
MSRKDLNDLLSVMERLRAPDGCPWDREQTVESLVPFIIEEAYEVIAAIDARSPDMLKDELGDLLFQIVFLCQLAGEEGHFTMEEVIKGSVEKMV